MSKIIISYRRASYDAIAGRIRDKLVSHYGSDSVYMDVDNIPFGIDFRNHINSALNEGDVVVAIIGPKWVGPIKGRKARIFDETDPVRVEIETALNRGIVVVPILVDGARMPKPEELPDTINKLAFHNAATVDAGRDFHQHMERVIRSMEMVVKTGHRPATRGLRIKLGLVGATVGIAALAIGVFAYVPQIQKQFGTYLGGQFRAVEPIRQEQAAVTPRPEPPRPSPITSGDVGRRVALVVGNSDYKNVAKLVNPVNDALAISNLFRSMGFTVITRSNISMKEFGNALRAFADEAAKADIAAVFYSGHGVEVAGVNYLIPVDATAAAVSDLSLEAVSLDSIFSAIEGARHLAVIFIDACRDNPFAGAGPRPGGTRSVAALPGLTRSVTKGFVPVAPKTKNTLIAYAAKAGSIAMDGDGKHSPFVEALLKHLGTPGLDIRIVLGKVRDDVVAKTNGVQEPAVYNSLGGETILLAGPQADSSVR